MALTDDEWKNLLTAAPGPQVIDADTYLNKKWSTFSQPAVFLCSDGSEYVLKSPRIGAQQQRAAVTEQIVSSLGEQLHAPVAYVAVVRLSQALIDIAPTEISYLGAGTLHGSKRIPNCSERAWLDNVDLDENRPRFASLAVLYGWTHASDQQLIYSEIDPRLVHSVDHGFFMTGPLWTRDTLGAAPGATVYRPIAGPPVNLSVDELRPAFDSLSAISTQHIATAVSRPPREWGITDEERLCVAKFLERRRDQILAAV